jgi:hypothetical protein
MNFPDGALITVNINSRSRSRRNSILSLSESDGFRTGRTCDFGAFQCPIHTDLRPVSAIDTATVIPGVTNTRNGFSKVYQVK